MKISIASKEDYSHIRELWEMIFEEDSKEYLDFYFTEVMERNTVVIAKENGRLVGMLHLNPYRVKGLNTSLYYIVGVATHPKYRRKGIMRMMLEVAHNLASIEKVDVVLLPEDERFYKPFGYEFVSTQYNTIIHTELYQSLIRSEHINYSDLSEDEFISWFKENNYEEKHYEVIHDDNYLQRLYKELTCEGGIVSRINNSIVLYYIEDVLEIRKVYLVDKAELELNKVVSKLLEIAQDKNLVIHEVNERLLSKVFSYSRKNNYDCRPYMMRLMDNHNNETIFFDEVV